jgi:hypothetical protein
MARKEKVTKASMEMYLNQRVVQPLIQRAENLDIEIAIIAGSSIRIPENLTEVTIKESLSQRGLEHEVDKD